MNNGEQVFSSTFHVYLGCNVMLCCVSLSFNSFHRTAGKEKGARVSLTMRFKSK